MDTPMIMFSGLLYQRNTIAPWLEWLEQLSLVNYGFSALVIQQVRAPHPPGHSRSLITCLGTGWRVPTAHG
jgi:hypothetical protein